MNMTGLRKLATPVITAIKGLDLLSPVVDLAARLWLADVFWKSGMTKIASWQSTQMLFNFEYHVPLLPPDVAAVLATSVELGGSLLLALGLASRFGSAALLILNVTAVVSYPDLSESGLRDHIFWGILLTLFFFHGPGKLSFDHWLSRKLMP